MLPQGKNAMQGSYKPQFAIFSYLGLKKPNMTKREFPRPLPAEQKATLDAVVEKIVATRKAEMILLVLLHGATFA